MPKKEIIKGSPENVIIIIKKIIKKQNAKLQNV